MAKTLGFLNLLYIMAIAFPLFLAVSYYFLLHNVVKDYEESYNTLGYISDDIITDIKVIIKNNLKKEIKIERNNSDALISLYDILNYSQLFSSQLSNDINRYLTFFNKYALFYGLSNSSLTISVNDNPFIFFTNNQRQRTYISGTNLYYDFFGNDNTKKILVKVNYTNDISFVSKTCRFNNNIIPCSGGNFGTGTFNVTLNYTDSTGNAIFNFSIDPTITNNFTITYLSSPQRIVSLQIGNISNFNKSIRFFIHRNTFAIVNATFINNEQHYIMAYISGNLYLKQQHVEKNISIVVLEEG